MVREQFPGVQILTVNPHTGQLVLGTSSPTTLSASDFGAESGMDKLYAAARAGSGTVLIFCDEAQRYNENEYEWLRDVHDALDRQQIKLFTFLVGQQELLAQKTALQIAGKTQIVARLMVEELSFYGIRNAEDVATCLNGYD